MANKDNSFIKCFISISLLLVLFFFEYFLKGQSLVIGIGGGSCIHDDLAVKIYDISRYISMISIVVLCILIIVFRKKSTDFFVILLSIFAVFIYVLHLGFSMISSSIRNNDICRDDMWNSKYCLKKDGECIKYFENTSDFEK